MFVILLPRHYEVIYVIFCDFDQSSIQHPMILEKPWILQTGVVPKGLVLELANDQLYLLGSDLGDLESIVSAENALPLPVLRTSDLVHDLGKEEVVLVLGVETLEDGFGRLGLENTGQAQIPVLLQGLVQDKSKMPLFPFVILVIPEVLKSAQVSIPDG